MYASIRGAITVEHNDKDEILMAAKELLKEIMVQNQIKIQDIDAVLFTATKDLTKVYPAVAARELGVTNASLMCMQEMDVEGSLEKCIRVMVSCETERSRASLHHIYLRKAASLRPDLNRLAVAIDGPVGGGKSTAARMAAKALGFIYVDTGAMYRAVALYCLRNDIDIRDEQAVEACLSRIDISIAYGESRQEIYLNGEVVTDTIRTQQVADGSSQVAAIQSVRKKLVALQQELAARHSVVMDGRDIGTKVLPWAQVKIYLDAQVEVRTERRMQELKSKGIQAEFEQTKLEILERDHRDMNRAHSPLRMAEDAVYLDTSHMSQEEVQNAIVTCIKDKRPTGRK